MRQRATTMMVVSLLLILAGGYVWHRGDEVAGARRTARVMAGGSRLAQGGRLQGGPAGLSSQLSQLTGATPAPVVTNRFQYRLSNTQATVNELARRGQAVLLENALIDTTKPLSPSSLAIPANLRSSGDPGTYIVESRGDLDDGYRAMLAAAGAQIISYLPVNAYLVRADAGAAARIGTDWRTQAVLANEPYYKIKYELLSKLLSGQALPADSVVDVVVHPADRAATQAQLARLGTTVVGEENSPFGTVLALGSVASVVPAVAGLPGVLGVELLHRRAVATDLSRVRLGVSPDTRTAVNNLGLYGSNVTVAVADTGVSFHPDFTGRLNGDTLTDSDGHGTHVAGIIAGSGSVSATVSNAIGSINVGTNGQYRGKAPAAKLLSLGIDFDAPFNSDTYLQAAAAATNALVSNNSWGFNGDHSYNITAANYDAAVRDSLPGVTGSQPVLYVFSAGNDGIGDDNGVNGEADTISAPGTAKNVITVGAIESFRNITNPVVFTNFVSGGLITNAAFLAMTDSSNQVASFSSRGNVGIGVEGDFGRFKPDVVAPGTMVVSTRSTNWNQLAYYTPTNIFLSFALDQTVKAHSRFDDFLFLPANTVRVDYELLPDAQSPTNFFGLPLTIYARADQVPVPPGLFDKSGPNPLTILNPNPVNTFWFFTAVNAGAQDVSFDEVALIYVTNAFGNYFQVLSNMNNDLGPYYRYETGTSMAAPAVSGLLALLGDFFTNRVGHAASPALLKALLINGARDVDSSVYDLSVENNINYQGWGLPNLTNSLPAVTVSNVALLTSAAGSPLKVFDQNPATALATGQHQDRQLSISAAGQNRPLRFTLVWTDPPGDPEAGLKLVNDLDLMVSNNDTGDVYFGNDLSAGADFNQPWDTNGPANVDFVNNVENIYLQSPLSGSNYTVRVVGRRVNVNAVTAHPFGVVQDYALVVASGNGTVPDAISVTDFGSVVNAASVATNNGLDVSNFPHVTTVPDGVPLLDQEAGENSPLQNLNTVGAPPADGGLAVITVGVTNQWHFYVFTNTGVNSLTGPDNATNVAFITFAPPTLSVPVIGTQEAADPDNGTRPEADIDMYVSRNPALLTLDSNAVQQADKSLNRDGTEFIVYTNSSLGAVYYIGIKAEDRQAASYGFFGTATDQPFSQTDSNGNVTVRGVPVPAVIPDGNPLHPGAALIFGIVPNELKVRRVVVTNDTQHELFGDLQGSLSHRRTTVVLNNHTAGDNGYFNHLVYEDNGEGDIPGSRHSDGPGSLRDFVGAEASGVWQFTMLDNSQSHTGLVSNFRLWLQPSQDTNDLDSTLTICQPVFTDSVDVRPDASNLTFTVTFPSGGGPVDLYVRYQDFPVPPDQFDYALTGITSPGGALAIDRNSRPPLRPGRYFFTTINPNAQCFRLNLRQTLDPNGALTNNFVAAGTQSVLDDAVTDAGQSVTNPGRIVTTEVGVRIDHPRISDLAITLVSPQGTRVLLSENRGGTTTQGMGLTTLVTNVYPTASAGSFNADTNILSVPNLAGTLVVNHTFYSVPDDMIVYYDGIILTNTGYIPSTNQTFSLTFPPAGLVATPNSQLSIVMNQGNNTNKNTKWTYTATVIQNFNSYFTFTEDTAKSTTPIKFYPPPFQGTPSSNVFFSSFEGVTARAYPPGTADGWTVNSNQVTVVTDSTDAFAGTNYLALSNGQIQRNVTTTAGEKYLLSYAYHSPLPFGPVSWWQAESNTLDSADGNDGLSNTNTVYVPGRIGTAFKFSGNNSGVQVGNPVNLQLQTFSITAWIKRSSTTSASSDQALGPGGIFFGGGSGGYNFSMLDNGNIFVGKVGVSSISVATGITDLRWHHVVVTTTGGTVVFYVDGVAYPAAGSYNPGYTFGAASMAIGGRGGDNRNSFLGSIDELSIYNRALTASEVRLLYAESSIIGGPLFNPGTGHYYYLLETNTWTSSELQAVALGGHLTSITNVAEQTWITNNFLTYGGVLRNLWIGLSDAALEGTFVWSSGEPFTYSNWASGEPNNCNGLFPENYVTIFSPADSLGRGGEWDDVSNDGTGCPLGVLLPEPNGIVEVNALPSFQVSVGGVTNIVSPTNTTWATGTINFTAPASSDAVRFTGFGLGAFLDSIRLLDLGKDAYVLPEEDLGQVKGEGAFGQWRLELWDNRAGMPAPAQSLLGWQLTFVFDDLAGLADVAPRLRSFSGTNVVNEETLLRVTNTASPAFAGDGLTYTNLNAWPLGAGIDGNGIITWVPGEVDGPGVYVLSTVVTESGAVNGSATNTLVVVVQEVNLPPVLSPVPGQVAFVNEELVVDNGATDPDFPLNPLAYTMTVAPVAPWLTIDPTSGIITGTPATNNAGGPYVVTTVVTDTSVDTNQPHLSATNTFNILVLTNQFTFTTGIPAFPGAEGAGAYAVGGRGGDVYHVTNLNDTGPGSLRNGLTQSHRTVVFDVSGTINLATPIKVSHPYITLAGQTAPGDGITLKGWVTSVELSHDLVVRHLRFRPGDVNCPENQDDAFHFLTVTSSIADHVTATWSIDEALSVTHSTNVTVQWSLIADPLNDACHDKGTHGFGSLLRYGYGALSFHHNLYADAYARSPRLGDNLTLDFVNNVVCNWGTLPGYSEDDIADNPGGFTNRLNYVGNYVVAGTNSNVPGRAFASGTANTWIWQTNNLIDSNLNPVFDGVDTGWGMFGGPLTQGTNFFPVPGMAVTTNNAKVALERVLALVGADESRDVVDQGIVTRVRNQTGHLINSQTEDGGWPALGTLPQVLGPDADNDGMPDAWELTFGSDTNTADGNLPGFGGVGSYTRLEDYLNWLAGPHAIANTNQTVDIDLTPFGGKTGNLGYTVVNGTNGTVLLLGDGHTARFTPTNNFGGGTNYGMASFGFTVTNNVTEVGFGPVTANVLVSKVPVVTNPSPLVPVALRIINQGTNSVRVEWDGASNLASVLLWTTNVAVPITSWSNIAGPYNWSNNLWWYIDNGAQTGGFNHARFYRLLLP